MKRFLVGGLVALFGVVSLGLIFPTPAYALECNIDRGSYFLSFPTWDRGLDRVLVQSKDGKTDFCDFDLKDKDIGMTVFTIALNIVDIMLRLVGILAVGFIIWGGIQYILARGEPEKAKKGLDTIIKAAVGLVIAMIAATLVSFIVWSLSK